MKIRDYEEEVYGTSARELKRRKPLRRSNCKNGHRPSGAGLKHRKPLNYLPKRTLRRAAKRRRATRAEQDHMNRVAALGCIACKKKGLGYVPCSLHHVRAGYGMSQRASHYEVLPLCEGHHQGKLFPVDPIKIAFHVSCRTFQAEYGSEVSLLVEVYVALDLNILDLPTWRGALPEWEGAGEPPWWPQLTAMLADQAS